MSRPASPESGEGAFATAWPTTPLAMLTTKIGSGATPRGGASVYLTSRVSHALVRSQNVFDRHFDARDMAFISPDHAAGLKGVELQAHDVLLNITGDGVTFGRACMVPADLLPACVNQHVAIVRANPALLHPGYLLAFLTHPIVKTYMESFNAGGSRRAMTKGHIESFRIPVPPMEIQTHIAGILSAYDDLIENCERRIRVLDEMARALYRELFVGNARRVPAQQLIDDGIVEINDGYRAKNSELGETGLPFARAGNINDGFQFEDADLLADANVPRAGTKISRPLDVVFTSKGTVGRFALVREGTPQFVYSPQLCFWRVLRRDKLSPHFLYRWMQSREFLDQVDGVKGSTDMADYVSLTNQRRMLVRLPEPGDVARADRSLAPIDHLVGTLTDERANARRGRDLLLPRLLSGQLSVRDAA